MVVTRTGSYRPPVMGTIHAVSSGHYLASAAGMRILEQGGNAIDAGVAAGICLNVMLPEMCGFGGVAPVMVYLAKEDRVLTLTGVGPWPKRASIAYFEKNHGGKIPAGVSRHVVPAAAGDWLTALELWGTRSFAEVVTPALELAQNGFPLHKTGAAAMPGLVKSVAGWPSSMSVFAPEGRPLGFGELLIQRDLARTFERLVAAEKAKSSVSREAGLRAARDEFYRGAIADEMVRFVQSEGGLLDGDDLARFEVEVEKPVSAAFGDYEVFACGPWCQGPLLAETLSILRPDDLRSLPHNSVEYIHIVVEALKLAFADRDAFLGDPKFVDVPIKGLLSPEYAAARRAAIKSDRAAPEMPPFGDPWKAEGRSAPASWKYAPPQPLVAAAGLDTSYACAVDRWGNAFSATPSDGAGASPIVPGLGFTPSNRGMQSWLDPGHPSAVAGGKRPRLTPNPSIAFRDGKVWLPFGTPGGDAQAQAMTQVFLNLAVHGMNVQEAVESPRFVTWSFPDSAVPHSYKPARLQLERAIAQESGAALAKLGHDVEWIQQYDAGAGGVCAIDIDHAGKKLSAGADMRRESYAIGR